MAGADRPALTSEVSEFGESFDRIAGELSQSFERVQNALTLKNLSLCKAYIEGRARIAVEFAPHTPTQTNRHSLIAVWHYNGHLMEDAARWSAHGVEKINALDCHTGLCRDQNTMFVGDVQAVDGVKFIPSFLEGLYRVENKILNRRTWRASTCFMSFKGAFRSLPILVEGKECVPVDASSVGLHEGAIGVIKGCPKVVDRIADNGGCMARQLSPKGALFPSVRVGLRPQGFDVVHHVGRDNRFKLLDVMVGPFYF